MIAYCNTARKVIKMDKEHDVILDSINEGVFTVDLDWRISSFNKAAERITGVSRKDAIGRSCADVFHANICEKECALKKTMETGMPVANSTAQVDFFDNRVLNLSDEELARKVLKYNIVGFSGTLFEAEQAVNASAANGTITIEIILWRNCIVISPDLILFIANTP